MPFNCGLNSGVGVISQRQVMTIGLQTGVYFIPGYHKDAMYQTQEIVCTAGINKY